MTPAAAFWNFSVREATMACFSLRIFALGMLLFHLQSENGTKEKTFPRQKTQKREAIIDRAI